MPRVPRPAVVSIVAGLVMGAGAPGVSRANWPPADPSPAAAFAHAVPEGRLSESALESWEGSRGPASSPARTYSANDDWRIAFSPASPTANVGPAMPADAAERTLPLAPATSAARAARPAAGGFGPLVNLVGSLAVILGLFLLVVWFLRRAAPRQMVLLPSEAFAMLGRAHVGGRHQVHLVRCGGKLLLLSCGPGGVKTLTEIDDRSQVERLTQLCGDASAWSQSAWPGQFDTRQSSMHRAAPPFAEGASGRSSLSGSAAGRHG